MMVILRSTDLHEYYTRLRWHTEQPALRATNAHNCLDLIGDTRLPPRNTPSTDVRELLHGAVFVALLHKLPQYRSRRNYVRDRLVSVRRRVDSRHIGTTLVWSRWWVSCSGADSILSNMRYRVREAFPRLSATVGE